MGRFKDSKLEDLLEKAELGWGVIGRFKKFIIRRAAYSSLGRTDENLENLYVLLEKYNTAREKEAQGIAGRELDRDLGAVGNYFWDALAYIGRKKLWGIHGFDKMMAGIDTTSKAGSLSIWRFNYVSDDGDYWQNPKETYDRQSGKNFEGDCEDWSRFFLCGLNRNSHNSYMYVTWDTETGHAICATEENSTIETVCTFHRINHHTQEREQVAKYWYPNMRGLIVYRQDPNTFKLEIIGRITPPRTRAVTEEAARPKNLKKLEDLIAGMYKIDQNFPEYVFKTLPDEKVKELKEKLKARGLDI